MIGWLQSIFRPKPKAWLICQPQEETWRWPDYLGEKTAGNCELCGRPIFFEAQNAKHRKACYHCQALTGRA